MAVSAVSLAMLTPDIPAADGAAPGPAASATVGRSTPPPQPMRSPSQPVPGGDLPSDAPPGGGRVSATKPGGIRASTGPSPRSTAAPPPAAGTDVTSLGGVVRVLCTDGKAQVISVQPNPGYVTKESRPGPGRDILVVLRSSSNESEIKARCDRDQLRPEVREHPR
jgi:hypothetical protein